MRILRQFPSARVLPEILPPPLLPWTLIFVFLAHVGETSRPGRPVFGVHLACRDNDLMCRATITWPREGTGSRCPSSRRRPHYPELLFVPALLVPLRAHAHGGMGRRVLEERVGHGQAKGCIDKWRCTLFAARRRDQSEVLPAHAEERRRDDHLRQCPLRSRLRLLRRRHT